MRQGFRGTHGTNGSGLRAVLGGLCAMAGCGGAAAPATTASAPASAAAPAQAAAAPAAQASAEFNPRLLRRFSAVRPVLAADPGSVTEERVALGHMLFFDARLSKNQKLSCNSCHRLDQYGVDGLRTSTGHKGQVGKRNSPTVYHAAAYTVQFWDGRAADVEEQAKGPVLNPGEMAMPNAAAVETVLRSIPGYLDAFKRAFPGEAQPVTFTNAAKSIGAFERKLITPSRWDRYLGGDKNALTTHEKEGLKAFTNLGCMVCHTGEVLGGTSYQRVGAVEPWPTQEDQGRYEVTKADGDRMMFKVPTLRNVEKTGPYFHDGSAATLSEAVKMMGKHQLGLALSDEEIAAVVAWLKSLTGELPAAYVNAPELPPSSPTTPKGDPS
jgi:cytochrome c peroxidase